MIGRQFEARIFLILPALLTCAMALGRAAQDAPVSTTIDVAPQRLLARPPGANWLSYNGDYTGRRYSSLAQIDIHNVARLKAQWVFHPGNSSLIETTPVVDAGVMLVTSANDTIALDARTGRVIWRYSRPVTEGLLDDASQHHSRGVAVWRSRVFVETDNAHLLCLDARSGHLIWDVEFADAAKNYGATSVPLVIHNRVLVGSSGGDSGVRGFLAAYDAETGNLAWRFWTIPGPGEPGSQSWPGKQYLTGGGTTWMPGTYDPSLNTLYWGTSNPAPDFDGSVRPGDDLYTDCVLALNPDTGKLKWYFQFTPHDLFDYDAEETPVLIDADYHGRPRKLLVEANRNGFLYVLDRTNGAFLFATPFLSDLNWARGIDSNGRPIRTDVKPSEGGTRVCPGFAGATNWYSPSYDPAAGLFFFRIFDDCETYYLRPQAFSVGQTYYATGVRRIPGQEGRSALLAYNVETGRLEWKYPDAAPGGGWGGTMTTAGGLVFFGDNAGSFEALDASTGKPLWHFNTGQHIHASPMSFAVNSKQYVAIASGSDIFAFALP